MKLTLARTAASGTDQFLSDFPHGIERIVQCSTYEFNQFLFVGF